MNKIIPFAIILILFTCASSMFYDVQLWHSHLGEVHENTNDAFAVSQYLVDYFRDYDFSPSQISRFTDAENAHMLEVKQLMFIIYNLVPVMWVCFLYLLLKSRSKSNVLFISGLGAMATLLLAFIPFPALWTFFHFVFFPQGGWAFPSSSMMVQIFPISFWLLIAKTFAARVFILSSLFIVGAKARIIERLL